jgi:membrane-bound serine protease (ClpP class)
MLLSLMWSMADLWPNEPFSAAWAGNAFLSPFLRLAVALAGSAAVFALLLRFLPSGWIWNRLAVRSTVGGTSQPPPAAADAVVGKAATALTTLAPSGYVMVEGRRYEAFCDSGMAERGSALRVVGVDNFRIIVTNT